MAFLNAYDASIDNVKNYIDETEQFFMNDLKEYFDDDSKYSKSCSRCNFAAYWHNFAHRQGIDVPLEKSKRLIYALVELKDNLALEGTRSIPFVSDTKELVDYIKLIEIGIKNDVISANEVKKDLETWNNICCENVNFKEVENATKNKELLSVIKPKNCIFKNCNLQGLEYITISLKNNEFKNCALDNEKTVSKKKGSKAKTSLKLREPKKVDKELSRDGRS